MRTMHLFAGIGGGLLADRILGHTPLVAVEWEPYACQVLRERVADGWFPGMHVWEGDVQLFDPSEYTGRVDCIHAGFPCQDISVAGKQAGIAEGTRSGLYREVLRIAGIVRPPYIFLENVAAITSKGLDQVLKDLAEMGYDSKWACLRASDVGAPHHRDRWWCLAHTIGTECEAWSGNGLGEGEPSESSPCEGSNVADPLFKGLEGQREITCRAGTEQQNAGDPRWWDIEPDVGRVAYGIPNRVQRLKGLGNAQVPLQAAVAFQILFTS
jgi:DNA (cytosine-5)-methyltransferase 1